MSLFRTVFCLAALAIGMDAAVAAEPPLLPSEAETADDGRDRELGMMLLGNHVFTFLHELGHGLIDQLGLPIVGQEEDAVDEFATISLIAFARDPETAPEDRLVFYQFALSGAQAFLKMWQTTERQIGGETAKLPFWDEHGLDAKRFTNIMCLLYGSEPDRFKPIVEALGMPEDRRARCVRDYAARDEAWSRLLKPHIAPDGAATPVMGRMTVAYGPAGSELSKEIEKNLKEMQVFEGFAEVVNKLLVLPNDIAVVHRDCGEANAFWSPDDRSITLCYELVGFIRDLLTAEITPTEPGPDVTAPPQPPSGTTQEPPPPPQPPAFSLVGVWQGQYMDPAYGMPVSVTLTLAADGQFQQFSYSPATGSSQHIWGTYRVNANTLEIFVAGSEPTQICNNYGCVPVQMPATQAIPIELVDARTMRAGGTYMTRVQ